MHIYVRAFFVRIYEYAYAMTYRLLANVMGHAQACFWGGGVI